jgi:hypothetical protein
LMDYSELFADEGRYYCSPYVGIVRWFAFPKKGLSFQMVS